MARPLLGSALACPPIMIGARPSLAVVARLSFTSAKRMPGKRFPARGSSLAPLEPNPAAAGGRGTAGCPFARGRFRWQGNHRLPCNSGALFAHRETSALLLQLPPPMREMDSQKILFLLTSFLLAALLRRLKKVLIFPQQTPLQNRLTLKRC